MPGTRTRQEFLNSFGVEEFLVQDLGPGIAQNHSFSTCRKSGSLLESLEEEVDEDAEAAWSVEIEKRLKDLDSGSVRPIPWSQVRRRLLRTLNGGR